MKTMTMTRAGTMLAIVPLALGALAACGSNDSDSREPGSTATQSKLSTDVPAEYSGPDAKFFTALDDPKIEEGASFKVGYLNVSASQPSLVALQKSIESKVEDLGGTVVVKDAQLDPQKQVSQMNELIAEGVDAVICSPVFGEALVPSVKQAKAKGIPFVTVIGSAGPEDVIEGATTSISQGFDYSAYRTVKAVADKKPGAKFATMGLGLPVKVLAYLVEREKYWAEELGLEYLGNVDATEDSPGAYSTAASTLLTKYPDVEVIAAYNDQSTVALGTTVSTQGSKAEVINPSAGQSITRDAMKAGRVDLAYRTPFEEIGSQAAIAAYNAVTDQGGELNPYIAVPSYIVTPENLAEAVWFD